MGHFGVNGIYPWMGWKVVTKARMLVYMVSAHSKYTIIWGEIRLGLYGWCADEFPGSQMRSTLLTRLFDGLWFEKRHILRSILLPPSCLLNRLWRTRILFIWCSCHAFLERPINPPHLYIYVNGQSVRFFLQRVYMSRKWNFDFLTNCGWAFWVKALSE